MAKLTAPIEFDHEYLDKLVKDLITDLKTNFVIKDKVDSSFEAMLHEIYMAGMNMDGEYKGCWVRFKDIETIINKYYRALMGREE